MVIGIVLVSHSAALAQGLAEPAAALLDFGQGNGPAGAEGLHAGAALLDELAHAQEGGGREGMAALGGGLAQPGDGDAAVLVLAEEVLDFGHRGGKAGAGAAEEGLEGLDGVA